MHTQNIELWEHTHDFAVIHEKGERRTTYVLIVTAITMVIEIIAGIMYGSMALLADGWHMGTHVAAFMITIFAYRYAKKHSTNPLFTFGTGKVSVLGGFSSAIALSMVALIMAVESVQRIIHPQVIRFDEAMFVAVAGLFVNVICAFILGSHHHDHDHPHEEGHIHHHHDHNLKAAYFHVLADALTSVTAIVALFFGKKFGWTLLDPVMGIVGSLVIMRWSYGLVRDTSPILLDKNSDDHLKRTIVTTLESGSDTRISDLHLWKVGPDDYAAVISVVSNQPEPAGYYKNLLKDLEPLSHVTIEVNPCNT